jgi:hypothetical protein
MDIKKTIAKIVLVLLVGASGILPVVAFASVNNSYQTPSLWPTGFWGPIVWCTGNYIPGATQVTLGGGKAPDTCNNLCDLIGTFLNAVYLIMSIAIFIITPIGVIWGGVLVMLSGANPGMLENGKKILLGTVIGLAIVLCSYLIVNTVLAVLNVTSVGSFNGNPGTCKVL